MSDEVERAVAEAQALAKKHRIGEAGANAVLVDANSALTALSLALIKVLQERGAISGLAIKSTLGVAYLQGVEDGRRMEAEEPALAPFRDALSEEAKG